MFISKVPAQPARFNPVDSNLYRGAAPETVQEFAFLKEIGVKTIISVDRAKPNFKVADSLGMRYIQIPIGYDKVPREKAMDFLKAIQLSQFKPPFFLHCHAGKFRGGAMAAVYRMTVDKWPMDSAYTEFINLAGSDKYKGLNSSVKAFKPPTAGEIAAWNYDPDKPLPAAPLAERMSDIDRLWDDLKKFGRDSLEQGGTALALEEQFLEINRIKACEKCDEATYKEMVEVSYRFQEMRKSGAYPKEKMDAVQQACDRCHEKIRN
ncbi:MAG: hypothetical protein JWP91_3935 [Fibrobacteres bacterium]|nr:hypothetical protein [Fibrobacterota bacterium]